MCVSEWLSEATPVVYEDAKAKTEAEAQTQAKRSATNVRIYTITLWNRAGVEGEEGGH